jgi:lipopolysaccharide transport system ATP-binding protein
MVGVIGSNGAGKSTLLRLVGSVGQPDEGKVTVNGRIGALLDLGAGFHPDLTGRENVFISGVIAGLTRRQVAERFDSIVEFAELEEFIDNPLRTYSTGMKMRLAFAVAVHIDPDILLVDEVLAVGDMAFQQKCLDRIAQFKEAGCTILLVSHDVGMVRQLCDEVLWLRKGQVVAYGPAEIVTDQYTNEMSSEMRRHTPKVHKINNVGSGSSNLRINENRFGSLEIEVTEVRLVDSQNLTAEQLESGDALSVHIRYSAPNPIPSPIFGVTVSQEDGSVCYDTSTAAASFILPTIEGDGQLCLNIERLDLTGGKYYVDVGIYEQNWAYAYDYHWHVYPLIINGPNSGKGVLHPPQHWQLQANISA